MNERLFWIVMVQWIACGIVVTILLGWLSIQRDRKPAVSDDEILRLPLAYAISGAIGMGVFLGALALSYSHAAEWRHPLTDLVFLLFTALSCWMFADYALVRFRVDSTGISKRMLSGGWRTIDWSRLREVRYSMFLQCFRLRAVDGATASLPVIALGLPAFARLVLRHAPAEAFDALTRERLESTAAGRPPAMW